MKNIFLVTLLCLCPLGGMAQTYTKNCINDTLRATIEREIEDAGYEKWSTPSYYQYLRDDLDESVQIMLVVNPAIDSIVIDVPAITIYGNYQKRFALEGGYGMIYNQYHDLYSSLFRFSEIEQVRVYDCWDDCRNITYLPIKNEEDEFLVRMQNAVMRRSWYIPDQDYYHLIGRDRLTDKNNYDVNGDFLSNVMDEIIINPHKK